MSGPLEAGISELPQLTYSSAAVFLSCTAVATSIRRSEAIITEDIELRDRPRSELLGSSTA